MNLLGHMVNGKPQWLNGMPESGHVCVPLTKNEEKAIYGPFKTLEELMAWNAKR